MSNKKLKLSKNKIRPASFLRSRLFLRRNNNRFQNFLSHNAQRRTRSQRIVAGQYSVNHFNSVPRGADHIQRGIQRNPNRCLKTKINRVGIGRGKLHFHPASFNSPKFLRSCNHCLGFQRRRLHLQTARMKRIQHRACRNFPFIARCQRSRSSQCVLQRTVRRRAEHRTQQSRCGWFQFGSGCGIGKPRFFPAQICKNRFAIQKFH